MGGRVDCAATVAALLLAVAQVVPAQSVKPASPSSADALAQSQPGPGQNGSYSSTIKVHGDWTIVVRNRDGSVASTAHFENSIASGGPSFFATLMARQAGTFFWIVRLDSLCGAASNLKACVIVESALANDSFLGNWFGAPVIPSLTISNPRSGPHAYRFVMSGSLTSSNTGQIGRVGTDWVSQNGASDDIGEVTATNLQTPVSVQAGQTIDVTVVIGFS